MFAIVAILTASYKEFIIINAIVIIHELGHCLIARMFGIEVSEIYIYPLGGITKLKMDLNVNTFKELLIIIAGPIFQFLALIILIKLFPKDIKTIKYYHYSILLFNLLPIYPLDGGKILNLLIELFTPYKLSIRISILISYLSILTIFLNTNIKGNIIIMIVFLLVLIIKEEKKINYLYNRFILERYLNNYQFKDSKIITNKNNFYRNKKHLIKEKNRYYLEKEYLSKLLKKY